MKTLKTLFFEELSYRYESAKQISRALPKIIDTATCADLKALLHTHLLQTEKHMTALENIFRDFDQKASFKKCQGMLGLLNEGEDLTTTLVGSPTINAAIIASMQKIEHYEIASYGCLNEWAKVLGSDEAVGILQIILYEENNSNSALSQLAQSCCNTEAFRKASGTNIAA